MNPTQHSQNPNNPGRRPETAAPTASPGPASIAPADRRQLEKAVSWTGLQRLRCLWYRIRLTIGEMNYATRRVVEVQAPWIADDRRR
jgi:hypothetical protein